MSANPNNEPEQRRGFAKAARTFLDQVVRHTRRDQGIRSIGAGEDMWLEPRQAQALLDAAAWHWPSSRTCERTAAAPCVAWTRTRLRRLLPRLREHRYFILPVPLAASDALPAEAIRQR